MNYPEEIVAIANKVHRPPEVVWHIAKAFDTFDRLSGLGASDIARLIVIGNGEEKPLPAELKRRAMQIAQQHGDVAKYFSPMARKKYLVGFVQKFLDERQQPKDYLFDGVLGFRRRDEDYKVEISTYGDAA